MLPSDLVAKLSTLLTINGELPAPAKVIQELLVLHRDAPNSIIHQTALLLSEPSLAIRLMHLVRSGVPISEQKPKTLSQALACLDDEQIAKWAKSLVAVDRFSSFGRPGGIYERTCSIAIVASLLVPSLAATRAPECRLEPEEGSLLGWCLGSGIFAAALTYPHLFETIFTRMRDRSESFEDATRVITGFSPIQLSAATCGALDLPYGIPDTLKKSASSDPNTLTAIEVSLDPNIRLLNTAMLLSHTMLLKSRNELGAILFTASDVLSIDLQAVREVLARLPDDFDARCATLGIKSSLPDHVVAFSKGRGSGTFVTEQITLADLHAARIDELRESIRRSDPVPSVILSAMEFLVWDFGFDRCVLMLTDSEKHTIASSSYLGRAQLEHLSIKITLSNENQKLDEPTVSSLKNALSKGAVTFEDLSLLPNGSNTTIIPIGYKARAVGVLYCDRLMLRSVLTEEEVATLTSLSDILDECVRLSKTAIT
jgi:hypothetical protein